MGLRKFMDQAKAQVEDAASKKKLDEAREKLQDKLHGTVDEAKTQAEELSLSGKQKLSDTRDKLVVVGGEVQQKATEILHRAEALLPQVIELVPILGELGFSVCEINVTLSAVPTLAITIEQQVADATGILTSALENREPPLTSFQREALGLLAKATGFAARMTTRYGYIAQQYELTLLPPSVTVHFAAHDATVPSTPDELPVDDSETKQEAHLL